MHLRRLHALIVALVAMLGCTHSDELEDLSGWELFDERGNPAPDLVRYEVNASLFADYADKERYIRLPPGTTITYDDADHWQFPEGTILVKTFSFGARRIETRLLVKDAVRFVPYVYVWNQNNTAATRIVGGAEVATDLTIDGELHQFDYQIPNGNQCEGCHAGSSELVALGPRTRQIDRDVGGTNQLSALNARGLFDRAPSADHVAMVDPYGVAPIDARARSYLDANCAHCHREFGAASSTGLWLGFEIEDRRKLGVCRTPIAAGPGTGGRHFDIVPGDPDASILVFRMESEEPGIKMPELPSVLHDEQGVRLIRAWIAAMPAETCD